MFGNSRAVVSPQIEPLPGLARAVERHLVTEWRKPPSPHTRAVWEDLRRWRIRERPLLLDIGCGRGASAHQLAQSHPGAQVLGIDKSRHRLRDAPPPSPDLFLARADFEELLPLLSREGWDAERVLVLYPNPWPKTSQAKRRLPWRPIFPLLLALGPTEMRTNWEVYAREWALAAAMAGWCVQGPEPMDGPGVPTSPFERKYHASGHTLWQVRTHG